MQFIKSFSTVTREDYDTVGYLASDLALIHENNFRIPLTFVITTDAYNIFLEKNGLKNKLMQIYHEVNTDEQLAEAYEMVKKLFLSAELPNNFLEELFETYHSVGGIGESADSIIKQNPNPKVMLIKSPNYIMEDDDTSGVFLNVQGEEKLVKAVKLCWASLFSPESAGYRLSHDIRMPENCGIIVQQFLTKGKNAVARTNNKTITVKTYLGIMDTHNELNKDEFLIDREYLQIKEKKIRFQQYRITVEEGKLVRAPLKQEGAEQKLNDKEVMEAARTAKRISNYLGKNTVIHMSLLNEHFLVKLCYRNTSPEPLELEEPTVEEEKTIIKVEEEIKKFEEEPEGEISETEITIEEDTPEKDMEFISFEEPLEAEESSEEPTIETYGTPEEEKEETNDEPLPEERVVQAETYEETMMVQETEKISEEPEIEDFIMPMTEEEPTIEIYNEETTTNIPKKKESYEEPENTKIMKHIRFDASTIIVKAYKELFDAINRKYNKIYGSLPESFGEGVRDLSAKTGISEQDLMEVKRLRDEFINNNRALTTNELKFVLDVTNHSLNILIK